MVHGRIFVIERRFANAGEKMFSRTFYFVLNRRNRKSWVEFGFHLNRARSLRVLGGSNVRTAPAVFTSRHIVTYAPAHLPYLTLNGSRSATNSGNRCAKHPRTISRSASHTNTNATTNPTTANPSTMGPLVGDGSGPKISDSVIIVSRYP